MTDSTVGPPDSAEPPPDPDKLKETPPVEERSFSRKVVDYLGDVLGIALVGIVFHKVLEHFFSKESLDFLSTANASFAKSLEGVDPWNLAAVYFGYVTGYGMAKATTTLGYIIGGEFLPHGLASYIWRLFPGAFYTASVIWAESWFNIVVALVALGIGYAVVKDSEQSFIHKLYGAPLIGCIFLWILLKLMMLASYLFGGVIDGVNFIAFGSFGGAAIVAAVAQEREHHVTGLFLKWLKPGERLIGS